MPITKTRVVGSGFSTFSYRGQTIAWLESVKDLGQAPVVAPEAIHPLSHRHPAEIVTPRAVKMGSLSVTVRELWNENAWEQLVGLAGTQDIVEIWERLAATPQAITCQVIIKPPNGKWRGRTYHGVVVTTIDDTESIAIGDLSVPRVMTLAYTNRTKL